MDNKEYHNEWLNSFGYTYTKKCTCGCDKTFGDKCNQEFHSDWCEKSPFFKQQASEDTFPKNFKLQYD